MLWFEFVVGLVHGMRPCSLQAAPAAHRCATQRRRLTPARRLFPRTSYGTFLKRLQDPIVAAVEQRVASEWRRGGCQVAVRMLPGSGCAGWGWVGCVCWSAGRVGRVRAAC